MKNLIVSFFSRLKKIISSKKKIFVFVVSFLIIILKNKKIFVFVVSFLIILLKNIERLKKTISSTKKIFVCVISFSIIRLTKIERTTRKIVELWCLMNDQFKYSFKLRNVINRLIIVWKITLSNKTLFFWESIFFWATSLAITNFFCFFFYFRWRLLVLHEIFSSNWYFSLWHICRELFSHNHNSFYHLSYVRINWRKHFFHVISRSRNK